MSPAASFVAAFVVTLALLGGVVASGIRGRRRQHVALVAGALASLGVTILLAYRLGDLYDLEAAGAITPVHMSIARVATASYLLPLATGILTWRDARWRRLHLVCAITALTLTVIAAATGTAMIAAAPAR